MTMDFFTRFALFHKSKVTISQMPAHQNLINPEKALTINPNFKSSKAMLKKLKY
jgi:hypothetical protein